MCGVCSHICVGVLPTLYEGLIVLLGVYPVRGAVDHEDAHAASVLEPAQLFKVLSSLGFGGLQHAAACERGGAPSVDTDVS